MKDPFISVIVATFNCGRALPRCIESFNAQTYPNKELVIIDGASSDDTKRVIEANSARIAYWESKPDNGIYHAWNKALKHAKGDWLYFMGGDDRLWEPLVLSNVGGALRGAFPRYRVVYGRVNVLRSDDSLIMTAGVKWDRKKFLQVMSIPHQGVFHHRSLFELYGDFDETFPIAGDYEMLLRELKAKDPLFVPEVIVAGMGFGGCSSNYAHSLRALNDIYMVRRKHRVPDLPFVFLWVYFKALVRRAIAVTAGERAATRAGNLYRLITGRSSV